MTEGIIRNEHEKVLNRYAYIFGFKSDSEYNLYVKKFMNNLLKILRKFKVAKEEDISDLVNQCLDNMRKNLQRMTELNSKEAKEELRKVIIGKMKDFFELSEQILNGK